MIIAIILYFEYIFESGAFILLKFLKHRMNDKLLKQSND